MVFFSQMELVDSDSAVAGAYLCLRSWGAPRGAATVAHWWCAFAPCPPFGLHAGLDVLRCPLPPDMVVWRPVLRNPLLLELAVWRPVLHVSLLPELLVWRPVLRQPPLPDLVVWRPVLCSPLLQIWRFGGLCCTVHCYQYCWSGGLRCAHQRVLGSLHGGGKGKGGPPYYCLLSAPMRRCRSPGRHSGVPGAPALLWLPSPCSTGPTSGMASGMATVLLLVVLSVAGLRCALVLCAVLCAVL